LARVPELSIIIPVRNEEQTIAGILRSLARQDRISDCQVVVVDGGSADGTATIATAFPFVELITAQTGLESQMNRGAKAAEGNALWFLHSDSTLPNPSTIAYILNALQDQTVVGGACHFQLRADDLYYRLINAAVNMRSKWLKRAYGDQGIFVRRETFRNLGGFREMPASDLDLFLRMCEHGEVRIVRPKVATSARTWQRYGKFSTTAWHLKEWLTYEWNRKTGRIPPPSDNSDNTPTLSQNAKPTA
jgi:rSAM/selenodomain-associated transferase 2